MSDRPLRWGILSTANIGRQRVIPAIHNSDLGEVVAVASRDYDRAKTFAEELNIPRAYGNYEDLLADDEIDAIYNPLPNHLHAQWSIAAAQAGIPTLCEKPLALNADEAQTMVDAFKEAGVFFAEAFMYRHHPRTRRVKQMVHEGAIGNIQIITASFTFSITDPNNIRLKGKMGGGSLFDVGTYCVSVMRHLTGEEPTGVTAQSQWDETDPLVDINTVGTLQFPSGVLGHFDCGFRTWYTHRYEVRGDEGRIVVENSFAPKPGSATQFVYYDGDTPHTIEIKASDHYQVMVEDFARRLWAGEPPVFDPQEGVEQMRTLDRLYAAAGRPTV